MIRKIWLLSLFIISILNFGCGRTDVSAAGNSSKSSAAETAKDMADLEIHFIDVGQGDATLLKCGEEAMLIDAGTNEKGTFLQNYIKKQGVDALSYLILTHPDEDHIGGADVILTKYDVDTVIMPDYEKDTATYRDVQMAMEYKRLKKTAPVPGTSYDFGDASFQMIAPVKEDYGDETNNYSISLLVTHGSNRFLFTGDAEKEAEEDILASGQDIKADVLKVGHHGSKSSTSEEFFATVQPEYAVISCGTDNSYGHPHAQTLDLFRRNKVKVYRTDEQGSILMISDGSSISMNTPPSESWKPGEPEGVSLKEEQNRQESGKADEAVTYILNVKSKKFHAPDCENLPSINRQDTFDTREEIILQGYEPCGNCNP